MAKSRLLRLAHPMSAFGCKADSEDDPALGPLLTQSGHRRHDLETASRPLHWVVSKRRAGANR